MARATRTARTLGRLRRVIKQIERPVVQLHRPRFSHVRLVVESDDPWDSTAMTRRSSPVETALTSRVQFPSALFSLEYDEIFPYERFAHNLLCHAVDALHAKDLPPKISIEFAGLPEGQYPWTLNCSITVGTDPSGNATSFGFGIPNMVPAIIYALVATALHDFFDPAEFRVFSASPDVFAERLKRLAASVNLGLKNYSPESFALAIRGIYEQLGLDMWRLHQCSNDYDHLTKLIANHEIAHAYLKQATRSPHATLSEGIAFEFIADLLATHWYFRKTVRLTPDSPEYRAFTKTGSHADSIFENARRGLRNQISLLVLMALAGAQRNQGVASLDGGSTHPNGLQRFLWPRQEFLVLLESNYSNVLSKDHFDQLETEYNERMEVLNKIGLVSAADSRVMLDPVQCDTYEVAANLLETLDVKELTGLIPHLRKMRETLSLQREPR